MCVSYFQPTSSKRRSENLHIQLPHSEYAACLTLKHDMSPTLKGTIYTSYLKNEAQYTVPTLTMKHNIRYPLNNEAQYTVPTLTMKHDI